jgi:hypothetical protein
VVAVAVAFSSSADSDSLSDGEKLAERVSQLLLRENLGAAASLMHYPPMYTKEEKLEDVAGVTDSLRFLIGEFGSVSNVSINREWESFFEVGAGGGDPRYWESISPFDSHAVVLRAHFSILGPGLIKIQLVRHPSIEGFAVHSINFGLSAALADSKRKMIPIMKKMMEEVNGMLLPPNIDELLEQNLRPVKRLEI